MTNQEIINSFPENQYIKKTDIESIVNSLFTKFEHYQEIFSYIVEECKKIYPKPEYNFEDRNANQAWEEWNDYFYGKYEKDSFNKIDPFGKWVKNIELEFIDRQGNHRTFKEACKIAADKWCEMIFGAYVQDNGAINEDHAGGFMACALGTLLKDKVNEKLTPDVADKAHKLIEDYYLNGCMYTDKKDGYTFFCELSVDYGPCTPLHELLVEAGVDERDTSNICPWKTSIYIDKVDNSVIIRGYQKRNYI